MDVSVLHFLCVYAGKRLKPKHAQRGLLVHAHVDASVGALLDEVAIPQVWQQLAPMQVLDDHSQVPVGQPLHPDVRGLSGQVPGVGLAAHVRVLLRVAAAALDVYRLPFLWYNIIIENKIDQRWKFMRLTIAHLADAHYGIGYPGPFAEARLEDIDKNMNAIADKIIAERVSLCVFAGDAFKDSKVMLDRARLEIVLFSNWLKRLSSARIPTVVLLGTPGHDTKSAYDFILDMKIPGVRIVTEPERLDTPKFSLVGIPSLDRRTLRGVDADMPPREQAIAMSRLLTNLMKNLHPYEGMNPLNEPWKPSILVAHQLCSTARGSADLEPWSDERRMTYPEQGGITGYAKLAGSYEPVLSSVDASLYDLVCLGHIHIPQRCGERMFYSGSPERLSFGDEHVETGFWLHYLDTEDRDFHEHEFVPTQSREYVTLKFNPIDGLSLPKWMNGLEPNMPKKEGEEPYRLHLELRHLPANILSKKIVRIDAKLTGNEFKSLSRSVIEEMLYRSGAGYVQTVETSNADKVKILESKEQSSDTDWFDPESALKAWGARRSVDDTKLQLLLNAYRKIAME